MNNCITNYVTDEMDKYRNIQPTMTEKWSNRKTNSAYN